MPWDSFPVILWVDWQWESSIGGCITLSLLPAMTWIEFTRRIKCAVVETVKKREVTDDDPDKASVTGQRNIRKMLIKQRKGEGWKRRETGRMKWLERGREGEPTSVSVCTPRFMGWTEIANVIAMLKIVIHRWLRHEGRMLIKRASGRGIVFFCSSPVWTLSSLCLGDKFLGSTVTETLNLHLNLDTAALQHSRIVARPRL